jgi:putative spermidine/putrescine transport system permease protein
MSSPVDAPVRASAIRGLWLALVLAFTVLPLAIIALTSFSSVSYGVWPPPGYSTRWYENLATQDTLGSAALRSLEVALLTTAVTTVLALLGAVALTRHTFIGRRLVEGMSFAPIVVPKAALGFALFIYFNRIGLVDVGVLGLTAAHVVITLPFASTLLTAALVRADRQVEEAAIDLGANPMRAFAAVTLPQLRPAMIASAMFVFIISFDEVDSTVFLLPTGRQTLPVWMYQYMQRYQDPTLAALSTLLIAGSLLLVAVAALVLTRSGVLGTLLRRTAR